MVVMNYCRLGLVTEFTVNEFTVNEFTVNQFTVNEFTVNDNAQSTVREHV